MSMKWFCSLCWRHGEREFGELDLADAQALHLREVNSDMRAEKKLAGFDPRTPMRKYPAVYCSGDARIGKAPKRDRFKKGSGPVLDLDSGEPIKL